MSKSTAKVSLEVLRNVYSMMMFIGVGELVRQIH